MTRGLCARQCSQSGPGSALRPVPAGPSRGDGGVPGGPGGLEPVAAIFPRLPTPKKVKKPSDEL